MSATTFATPDELTSDSRDHDPCPVREHIRLLRTNGGSYRGIAAAAGVDPRIVRDLLSGRRLATPYTTTALLAVTSGTLPRARVDAGGTRLRLRALHVMGHGSPRIARAVGADPQTIRALVRGTTTTVSPKRRDAITVVYDAWWDKRAPTRTRHERRAATLARRHAIAGNWCAAAALDDDQLDAPGYRPQSGWRPAIGTGIAADIYPPKPKKDTCPTTNS